MLNTIVCLVPIGLPGYRYSLLMAFWSAETNTLDVWKLDVTQQAQGKHQHLCKAYLVSGQPLVSIETTASLVEVARPGLTRDCLGVMNTHELQWKLCLGRGSPDSWRLTPWPHHQLFAPVQSETLPCFHHQHPLVLHGPIYTSLLDYRHACSLFRTWPFVRKTPARAPHRLSTITRAETKSHTIKPQVGYIYMYKHMFPIKYNYEFWSGLLLLTF